MRSSLFIVDKIYSKIAYISKYTNNENFTQIFKFREMLFLIFEKYNLSRSFI